MVKSLNSRIVSTPGVCGGRPRIEGTRIRVIDIAIWHHEANRSAEKIASEYDLGIVDIYAAIAYYAANKEAIQSRYKADKAFIAQVRKTIPSKIPRS